VNSEKRSLLEQAGLGVETLNIVMSYSDNVCDCHVVRRLTVRETV